MYHIRPHIRLHLFHYFKNKELDELYFSVGIRAFAESMITIFVPIYLMTLGYALQDIIIYFLVFYVTIFIFYTPSFLLNYRFGVKKTMFLGLIFLILYNIILDRVAAGIPYFYAAVIWGVSFAVYYTAFHIDFSTVSDRKKEGKEFSNIKILWMLSATLGPLVGAVLISEVSYSFVFMLVSLLLLFSAFPLFLTKDRKIKKPNISLKKIMKSDTKRRAAASQGLGILDFSSGFLWPLFIYIVLGGVLQLGMIVTLTSVIIIIFLYYIGKMSDRYEKKTLGVGVGVHSVSWLTRIFFLTPVGLFLNNFYSALSYSLIEIPYHKVIYEKAKKTRDIANYFILREINIWIGRMIVLFVAFILMDIALVFIFVFFATFLFTPLMKEPSKRRMKEQKRKRRK